MNHSAGSEQRKQRGYYTNDTSKMVVLFSQQSDGGTKTQETTVYYSDYLFSQTQCQKNLFFLEFVPRHLLY